MITKRQLLSTFKTSVAIAHILECTPASVSLWPMDGPIPAVRELQLQVKFPKMFGKPQPKELLPRLLAELSGPRMGYKAESRSAKAA
jgi:hypothetical protein